MTPHGHMLAALRQSWAGRPRIPQPDWVPRPPPWLEDGMPHHAHFDDFASVWESGEAHLAILLRANNALFKPGDHVAAGDWAWTPDRVAEVHLEPLYRVADAFRKVPKGTDAAPGVRRFVARANDDFAFAQRALASRLLTAGRVVCIETLVVDPRLLPGRCLRHAVLPIALCPAGPRGVVVLPSSLWPPALLEDWA